MLTTAATARDLISAALSDMGILAAGEVPTADDASDALNALNRLLDQWAAENLTIYTVTRTTHAITSGDNTYTVGATGDIAITRPVFFEGIKFQDTSTDPATEYNLVPHTEDSWAQVRLKDLTSVFPNSYYYNPTYPNGTIYLWPVPTSATLELVLYSWTAVPQFTGLTVSASLPPGYQRAIVKNLAVDLAPAYEKAPSQLLLEQARESKMIIQRANKRLTDMSLDPAALIQGKNRSWLYSIYTG